MHGDRGTYHMVDLCFISCEQEPGNNLESLSLFFLRSIHIAKVM